MLAGLRQLKKEIQRRISRARWDAPGVALLMVMISLSLLTIIVADLEYNESAYYRMAIYERDALRAEAMAESGLQFGRLFLVIQGKIQPFITAFASNGVPLPGYTLWQLMSIDSNLITNLASGDLMTSFGLDLTESLEKRKMVYQSQKAKAQAQKKTFDKPEAGFGAFDGEFSLKITDEESKISLRDFENSNDPPKRAKIKNLLLGVMEPDRYDALFESKGKRRSFNRLELIANVYDYIDQDELKIDPYALDAVYGQPMLGSEKDYYDTEDRVIPKNAFFDSLEELRLVAGFSDAHYNAFSPAVTIYGQDAKVNILSAGQPVVEALMRYCAKDRNDPKLKNSTLTKQMLNKWSEYKSKGGGPVSPKGFITFLGSQALQIDPKRCEDAIGVKSYNFTLKSTGKIGGVARTLTLVARVKDNVEEIYYFANN